MGLLPLATRKKGAVLYWEVRLSCTKNQLDLIQAQRTLKGGKKKECIQEALGEFKFS